ncbi:MAG TPA: PAS domain S-box protein [Geothrix sp.]|jgi:PAS domain S-box-containing protein
MTLKLLLPTNRPDPTRAFLVLFGVWTLVAACFLGVLMYYTTMEEHKIALNRAMDSYHKDLAYRRWAAERGGVYVPLNGKTPPNPYLAHLPERDITTTQGKRFTLVNPAYMTRMVHELGEDAYGLRGHITSLRPIRPDNAPDPWERKALEAFEHGARELSEVVEQKGGRPILRFMGAFLVEPSCLACHAHQGYKVGEVRGGISITVPVGTGPMAVGLTHRTISVLMVAAFWVIGGVGLAAWIRRRARTSEVQRGLIQDLAESSQQFEAIRDTTPDSLWFLDHEGRIQWVNDTYCRMSGYGREELRGQPVSFVEAAERPEDIAQRIAKLRDTPGGQRFRTRHRAKDGRLLELEITAAFLPSKDQIVAFLRDITQEVQTAAQIQESEMRFRLLFASSPAPMFIQRAGHLIHANQAMAGLLEVESPDELLGRAVTDIIHPNYHALVRDRVEAAHRQKVTLPPLEEIFITLGGRQVWVEVQAVSLDLPGGPAMLVFAVDLTERRRSEEHQRKLEAEVQHAQKLDSLGSLAGGIAHDMNNVLAAILGMSTLLQAKAGGDEALARSLQTIEKAAGRGRDLVKGLTDFARKGLQEARIMDLNALVREELELLVRTTRHRFTFDVHLEEGLAPIMGEPSTVGSAFMNLCVNAFDAMPQGGTLEVTTHRQGSQVVLVVTDTGHGIPPEILPRITEPFFTTKPTGRGTGLGLAMVYGTMKAHGGSLDIQSEVGKGTSIRLCFPGATAEVKAEAAGPASPQALERSLRVLVVDDDALIRSILPDMLEQLGHHVETASSGLEAIRRLDAGLLVDLVILDHNMPGLSGAETLPRILQLRPGVRILLATGFLDNDLKLLLAGFPAVLAIQKPFSLAELRHVLREEPGGGGADCGLSDSSGCPPGS